MQLARRHRLTDRDARGQRHRPGIEPDIHLHDHHAGLGIARHDRPLDGRGAAPARQQRGMAVIAAQPRPFEDRLRQQQAVSHDHCHIGIERAKGFTIRFSLEIDGRAHLDTQRLSRLMHGRRLQLQPPPPRRAWRLRIDRDDLMPCRMKRLQHRNGKIGRAHENDAKRHGSSPVCGISALQTDLRAANQALRNLLCCASPAFRHERRRSRRSFKFRRLALRSRMAACIYCADKPVARRLI